MKWIFILVLVSTTVQAESIRCIGAYWQYEYTPGTLRCEVVNTVHKDIPGTLKKGYSSKNTISNEECWKSVAKIQMDGAKCCLRTENNLESLGCAK